MAFLVSPFPGALLQSFVVAVWPKEDGYGIFAHPPSMFVFMCLVIYFFGLIFGAPTILFLAKRKIASLRAYIFAGIGVMISPIILVVIFFAINHAVTVYAALYNLALFIVSGAFAGALFWFVSQPDQKI